MDENTSRSSSYGSQRFTPRVVVSILVLAGLFGGLMGYKSRGGLQRINELRATGSLRIDTEALRRPAGSEFAATGAQMLV
jgi:hypothetical protein